MKKGFTLVEVMIIIAIIALLGIIIIPNILRIKVNRNETNAKEILKMVSLACESYAKAHNGNYPAAITDLITGNPPYLKENYTSGVREGYTFRCNFGGGYSCTASPEACIKVGQTTGTGSKDFTITTGGLLTENPCAK